MACISDLVSAGIIEKDINNDVLWTWSYPSISTEYKTLIINKCGLGNGLGLSHGHHLVSFCYYHHQQSWFYLHLTDVFDHPTLLKVKQFVLVLQTRDFNPEKYENLSRILSKTYSKTGNPANMLQLYLSVLVRGSCSTEDNGTFMIKQFDKIATFSCVPAKDNLGALHFKYDQARRRFVEWAQNEIAVVPDFHKRILFSDEAHFWLNGHVNKQNCRIWSEANPQVYVETLLHPEKLTVWCALWAGGIIGPYFFKNDEGHNVTVNGDRYRAMITNFFIPELNSHDVQELWFQQDGATCHTARATIDLLKDTFGDRLISRFGPVNWPPRSCDLTPLDYFLWGYVKSLVYADKPQTLDHLEDNIRLVIADIRPQMLEKVIENWPSRLDYIRASHGSHMPEIIFKM
ncbi:putative DENN domain-containing protein 10 B [Trichonephila clavipes]|nr:putative DENN domain-containing protein 10 B [Trichonephila clavipes]